MSDQDLHTGVKEHTGQKVDEPPMYRVILLNDHYTTMDFVVMVIRKVFHRSTGEAVQIMMDVHKNGRGVAGIYSRDIAATKRLQVLSMAKQGEFPLRCEIEPDE
jgi:ATP-dependent Clp protease adaptor protein ClpS